MEERYEKIIDGATAEMIKNDHGYFCRSWNGIDWPWGKAGQLAATSEEEAVRNLTEASEDDD